MPNEFIRLQPARVPHCPLGQPNTFVSDQRASRRQRTDPFTFLVVSVRIGRPAIPTSNSGSLYQLTAAPVAETPAKDAELKKMEDRVRHRQSVLLEQTNELQELEKRLQAAEARKRELESRGGFV